MSFELKDKSFSLFRNKNKEKETWPDFQGKLMVDGKLYYMSAWSRKTEAGEVYLSGVIKEAEKKDAPATADEFLGTEQAEIFPEKSEKERIIENSEQFNQPNPEDDLPF